MNRDLHQKIEDVLNSLDGLQPAAASPFLYSRIRNRMKSDAPLLSLQWRWRLAVAMIVLLLLNLATLSYQNRKDNIGTTEATIVAQEYSINLPQSY
jgi:hypothetical protein